MKFIISASGRLRRSLEIPWKFSCPNHQWLIFSLIILKDTLRRSNANVLLSPLRRQLLCRGRNPVSQFRSLKLTATRNELLIFLRIVCEQTAYFSICLLKPVCFASCDTASRIRFFTHTYVPHWPLFVVVNVQARTLATSALPSQSLKGRVSGPTISWQNRCISLSWRRREP